MIILKIFFDTEKITCMSRLYLTICALVPFSKQLFNSLSGAMKEESYIERCTLQIVRVHAVVDPFLPGRYRHA